MSILEAVVALATLVKQVAADTAHNMEASQSLAHRVGLIPRLLEGFPDPTLLDDGLMQNLFQQLRSSHELVSKYKDMGRMARALKSSFIKEEFIKAEAEIEKSVRDLTLAVGIFSAGKISGLASDLAADVTAATLEDMEEDSTMDLADFGDMCETVEMLDTAVAVFQPPTPSRPPAAPMCSAVMLGNKLVVVNFPMAADAPHGLATKSAWAEEGEEDEVTLDGVPSSLAAPASDSAGVVIFHIDNTGSMKQHGRMELTKKTLLDVMPDFLRKGFRVIVNAWASDPITKGRIQTKEVIIPPDILNNEEDGVAIKRYLDANVFTILTTKGKTDLYGSFFQLLRQSRDVCLRGLASRAQRSSLLLFVLTDGIHNHLDYPMHAPQSPDEDYFGVYAATKDGGTKFGRTAADYSALACERFLRSELDGVVSAVGGAAGSSGYQVLCTIIGIGEADTAALSCLATALGNDVMFYGITQVEHIETVFRNINIADTSHQLTLNLPGSSARVAFQYCYEEDTESDGSATVKCGTISGCCLVEDPNVAQRLHHSRTIELQYGDGPVLQLTVCDGTSPYLVSSAPEPAHTAADGKVAKPKEPTQRSVELAAAATRERMLYWEALLPLLKAVSSKPYAVTPDSFGRVFTQLLGDRKALVNIKSLLFSRNTRKMRDSAVFAAVAMWLRELGDLVESQVSSFRMNVEDELLSALSSGGAEGAAELVLPSQMVLDRLAHNLQNAGKATHRIKRLMTAISNIRDRSLQLASRLVNQSIVLEGVKCGDDTPCLCCSGKCVNDDQTLSGGEPIGQLVVRVSRSGKDYSVPWRLCGASESAAVEELQGVKVECRCRHATVQREVVRLFDAASPAANYTGVSPSLGLSINLSFPCVALRACVNQFTIVHSTNMFNTVDLCVSVDLSTSSSYYSLNGLSVGAAPLECVIKGVVFDAEELFGLCAASDHTPGSNIPLLTASGGVDLKESNAEQTEFGFNMVLPLAYTPLLMALYIERGRVFHSAINVTGDCMALAPVAVQWGKFYHDAMLKIPPTDASSGVAGCVGRVWAEQAVHAVVSFSYAISSHVLPPSRDTILAAFGANVKSEKEGDEGGATESTSSPVVMSRDTVFSALTCPVGVACIVAGGHLAELHTRSAWSLLGRTLFSRMCEAIAGHKNIRYGSSAATTKPAVAVASDAPAQDTGATEEPVVAARADPGMFDDSYRTLLGELQMMLRHRLHVEWSKLSLDGKVAVLKAAGAKDVLFLVKQIVDRYLSQFGQFGLVSWPEVMAMLQRSLLIANYGIERVKSELIQFSELTELVGQLLQAPPLPGNAIPVFFKAKSGEILVRELCESDYEEIVLYIDAIVATKASPKVAFKPILNPSHPIVNCHDPSLKITVSSSELDLQLPVVSVGFIGNVNSGKSSIVGRALMELGLIRGDVVHKLAKEAERVGLSASTKYAWLLDKTSAERGRGVTIASSWVGFQSCFRRFGVVDNPGHSDFAKNCVNGIFQSDVAVLVTSAVMSEVTAAELGRSQAEEQLMVAFCFGIRHIVVAVNKMDAVGYNEDSYREVCAHTGGLLKKAGFKPEQVTYVPVSALEGVNLASSADTAAMKWYSGSCLLEALDNAPVPKRALEKPLRFTIDEVNTIAGIGTVLCGRVECGSVSPGDKLVVEPCGITDMTVVSIETFHNSMGRAVAGEEVGVAVRTKKDEKKILQRMGRGMVASLVGQPPMAVMERFEAQLFIVRGSPIRVGYRPAITSHLDTFSVTVVRLIEIIGKNNRVITENPAEAAPSQTVVLELKADRRFAGDTIHDNPRLSRFLIKENRVVVALGFIRRKIS